jgi:hypothetical protein
VTAGAQPDPLKPVAVNQQPARAAYAASSTGRPEAVTGLTGAQARAEAGSPSHLHQGERALAHDVAGLTDPLTEAL